MSLKIKERAAGTGSGVSQPRYLVSVEGEKDEWLSPLEIVQRFGEAGKAQIKMADVLKNVQKQPEVILGKDGEHFRVKFYGYPEELAELKTAEELGPYRWMIRGGGGGTPPSVVQPLEKRLVELEQHSAKREKQLAELKHLVVQQGQCIEQKEQSIQRLEEALQSQQEAFGKAIGSLRDSMQKADTASVEIAATVAQLELAKARLKDYAESIISKMSAYDLGKKAPRLEEEALKAFDARVKEEDVSRLAEQVGLDIASDMECYRQRLATAARVHLCLIELHAKSKSMCEEIQRKWSTADAQTMARDKLCEVAGAQRAHDYIHANAGDVGELAKLGMEQFWTMLDEKKPLKQACCRYHTAFDKEVDSTQLTTLARNMNWPKENLVGKMKAAIANAFYPFAFMVMKRIKDDPFNYDVVLEAQAQAQVQPSPSKKAKSGTGL